MSSFPLTNSIIFQNGEIAPPTSKWWIYLVFLWRCITATKLPHIGGALVWRQWRSLGWSNSYPGCCSLFHPWPFILFFIMDPPLFGKSPRCPTWKSTNWDSLWEWLNTIYVYHLVPLYAPKKKTSRHQPGAVQKLMDERVQEALLSEKWLKQLLTLVYDSWGVLPQTVIIRYFYGAPQLNSRLWFGAVDIINNGSSENWWVGPLGEKWI